MLCYSFFKKFNVPSLIIGFLVIVLKMSQKLILFSHNETNLILEISKIDASASVVMSVNNSLVCWGLETYGNEEQKQKYLPAMAAGRVCWPPISNIGS